MTDNPNKGIVVQTTALEADHYEKAAKTYVKDGHLHVAGPGFDIAIYAPGTWRRAYMAGALKTDS